MPFIKNGQGTSLGVVKVAQPATTPKDDQDNKSKPQTKSK